MYDLGVMSIYSDNLDRRKHMQCGVSGGGGDETLELVTCDPYFRKCFHVLEDACLSNDILCFIGCCKSTPKFHAFVQRHYKAFCKDALKAFYFCGFVPYHMTRLQSGDTVPEVLPLGTFSWRVEVCTKTMPKHYSGEHSSTALRRPLIRYMVTHTVCEIPLESIQVFEFTAPVYHKHGANNTSPLHSAVRAYNEYHRARKYEGMADDWNVRAHLVATTHKTNLNNDGPQGEKIRTGIAYGGGGVTSYAPDIDDQAVRNLNILQMIKGNGIDLDTIDLFTMPQNTALDSLRALSLVTDTENMRRTYMLSVCGLMGVPVAYVDAPAAGSSSGARDKSIAGGGGGGAGDIPETVFSNHTRCIQEKLCQLLQVIVSGLVVCCVWYAED